MNTFTPIAIVSPEKQDDHDMIRHEKLQRYLKNEGFSFKPVKGYYKGNLENSYVIILSGEKFLDVLKSAMFSDEFKQNSILYVDANRYAKLIYSDGIETELGKFHEIDKTLVRTLSSYTYDKANDTYYTTSHGGMKATGEIEIDKTKGL